MAEAKNFFTETQKQAIVDAIAAAEKNTSGEIRVHIENLCTGDPLEHATRIFHRLKMDRTELRNGVLFYLAVKDKKYAIVGDKGIHDKVGAEFWNEEKKCLAENFATGLFTEGLCEGIRMAGNKLKQHFPFTSGDTDELSNEVSFNK